MKVQFHEIDGDDFMKLRAMCFAQSVHNDGNHKN